jgi:hypothetical protein
MKFRVAIEVADTPGKPDEAAAQVVSALLRFANAMSFGGCLPTSPVPLWAPDGKIIGRAWTELEDDPRVKGPPGEAEHGAVPGL